MDEITFGLIWSTSIFSLSFSFSYWYYSRLNHLARIEFLAQKQAYRRLNDMRDTVDFDLNIVKYHYQAYQAELIALMNACAGLIPTVEVEVRPTEIPQVFEIKQIYDNAITDYPVLTGPKILPSINVNLFCDLYEVYHQDVLELAIELLKEAEIHIRQTRSVLRFLRNY